MPFTVFLGADDHTDSDGPYNRLIKCRKWIYALALVLVLHYRNLIDYAALDSALKYVHIPERLVLATAVGGSLYLILQYILISYQLYKTHKAIMQDRFGARKKEDMEKLSAIIDSEGNSLQSRSAHLVEAARLQNAEIFEKIETAVKEREQRELELAKLDSINSNAGKFSLQAKVLRTTLLRLAEDEASARYIYTHSTDPERLTKADPHYQAILSRLND